MARARWLEDVAEHDFAAALAYLTIRLDADRAATAVAALREQQITDRRVNDILRGCGREPLPAGDPGVIRDLKRIRQGRPLSPILVVSFQEWGEIADGYHRASAIYRHEPFAQVPCRLAHLPDLVEG